MEFEMPMTMMLIFLTVAYFSLFVKLGFLEEELRNIRKELERINAEKWDIRD